MAFQWVGSCRMVAATFWCFNRTPAIGGERPLGCDGRSLFVLGAWRAKKQAREAEKQRTEPITTNTAALAAPTLSPVTSALHPSKGLGTPRFPPTGYLDERGEGDPVVNRLPPFHSLSMDFRIAYAKSSASLSRRRLFSSLSTVVSDSLPFNTL